VWFTSLSTFIIEMYELSHRTHHHQIQTLKGMSVDPKTKGLKYMYKITILVYGLIKQSGPNWFSKLS
jgi:hypothetical protein